MGRISKLHEYTLDRLNSKFTHLHIQENYYPEWLISPVGTRLELDVFISELNIAAEIQGGQHSFYVPFFHRTIENFNKQKEYDEHKQYICRQNGIRLYDISTQGDADIMIYEIAELLDALDTNRPKYFYQDTSPCDPRIKKEKWHEIEKRKALGLTRKQMKKENVNSVERMARRLESCKNNLSMYESGGIQASEEKINFWIKVINNNGYEENPHDKITQEQA